VNKKNTLILALEGNDRAISKLCDYFRRVAVAYLRTKAKRNNLLLGYLYKNIDDLALDCIADLFGKEGDCLSQIESYIDKQEVVELKESEVEAKIRRLIFSKVNEGLYRNYSKFDPSLSKIIRNLKRTLDEEKVVGASYNSAQGDIEFDAVESGLPIIPDELLEIRLSPVISEIQNMVDAVEQLKIILNREDAYQSKIPLVAFAVILRKTFAYQLDAEGAKTAKSRIKKEFVVDEIQTFIDKGIEKQKKQLHKTYVETGKIDAKQFEKYLLVVREILSEDLIGQSPREGYFEHFEFYFPEVSYLRYRAEYRKIIEYLTKKVREEVILYLKNEENFSKFTFMK
jgi:hypothetical protein